METLIILGSRDASGQTSKAADALKDGLLTSGNEAEKVFLPAKNVQRCRQCYDNGWGVCRSDGRCVIEDDFEILAGNIRKADAVVFATPVYFSGISESMRAFLDRLRRVARHAAGRNGIENKPAVGICVAGGGGGGAPACSAILEKILLNCGFNVIDMIPARRQNIDMKKDILRTVGKWMGKEDKEN
jgi:multimeric flavodoxin WrbA